jgi:hypothetical protein
MQPGYKAPFTARQVAPPPISMCKLGNLLKYRHLMKDPKYKDIWTKSFGTEIPLLTKTTETIFLIRKEDIPSDRMGDETYARIVSVFCDGKKGKYRTRVTMGGNLVTFQVTAEHQLQTSLR